MWLLETWSTLYDNLVSKYTIIQGLELIKYINSLQYIANIHFYFKLMLDAWQ